MEESELREVWRSHYEMLSNEEFDWDRNSLGEKQVVQVDQSMKYQSKKSDWQSQK